MERRLARRGYSPETIGETLSYLEDRGFLDDAEFARSFVRSKTRGRPVGRRYLVYHLENLGITRDLSRSVVEELVSPQEEARLAREMLARLPSSTEDDRRRAYRTLLRRGFPPQLSQKILEEGAGDS